MAYFNYHARAKHLLKSNSCIAATIFKEYHHIRPALVLYFSNHKPMPIRDYMWHEYLPIIKNLNIKVLNPDNISIDEFL